MKKRTGFTLVELLAVIVILALLIVITANTVLPMMKKTKKSAMVVYASNVLDKASAAYMADSLSNGGGLKKYSIEALMGQSDYYGVVGVELKNGKYEYSIAMFDAKEGVGLKSKYLTSTSIEKDVNKIVLAENYNASSDTIDTYKTHEQVSGYNFTVSEGEKSKNLFNLKTKENFIKSSTTMDDTYSVVNQKLTRKTRIKNRVAPATLISSDALVHFSDTLTLSPGTYIWSVHNISSNIEGEDDNKTNIVASHIYLSNGDTWAINTPKTFTSDVTISSIYMNSLSFILGTGEFTISCQIQIEEGSTVTDYEPYYG